MTSVNQAGPVVACLTLSLVNMLAAGSKRAPLGFSALSAVSVSAMAFSGESKLTQLTSPPDSTGSYLDTLTSRCPWTARGSTRL